MSVCTPNRNVLNNSFALERSLSVNKTRRTVRKSFIWGSVNLLILAVLLYDIANSCPLYTDIYDYIKYAFVLIVSINLLYYAAKIMISNFNHEQIPITLEQKKLLGISDSGLDPNFKVVDKLHAPTAQTPSHSFSNSPSPPSSPLSSTPMNMTANSWRSTPNDSLNYSLSSPSWTYHKVVSGPSPSSFSSNSPIQYRDTSGIEFIQDEKDLDTYLKEFEANTSVKNLNNQTQQPSNLLSSFWSHPVTKTAKDMSSFLKRCTYQLATQSPTNLNSSSPKNIIENKSSPTAFQTSALAHWSRLNIDIVSLTQWNENLRKWISQTILERLIKEFDNINESFEKHGLTDIKIGQVGLDRLRKTAQVAHVTHFIPSLPTLIPFLEVTSNQEYLEKRIRELAKGGCMSDFKWSGGSGYNGKDWDDSLPTDSAIIMHLFASYLDTQLMPLPSMPDTKPFSGLYYIKSKDKVPTLTPNSLFIQQVTEKPPHFRVIVGETIYEMVKGYNNLFHSILFFLYHVNKQEHGMLGRVNLGRAGVNMLWIIGQ
nr:PREDICTED: transmembrane protein 209 isoform X1 [Tribolium castaneum]|eukprot:XP_015837006.1 PREDICTED: transmembrane protein 209 isoform X1 [Tribolium castaneum]